MDQLDMASHQDVSLCIEPCHGSTSARLFYRPLCDVHR
jgi:hypothetical protein